MALRDIHPLGAIALALVVGACGGDDDSMPGTDAGQAAGDSGTATDAGSGDTDGGATTDAGPATDGGPTDDGGIIPVDGGLPLGCANGGPLCRAPLMCCSGVPYPSQGVCADECTMRSDRHAKEGFAPVDPDAVLERLAQLPVSEWSYRDEGTQVRHVGPMAQDFHAAFGLGRDDRTIHPVDANGVTIAAIQALTRRVEELGHANESLRDENRRLRSRVERLERR